jgi:hypothetical protein
MYYEKEFALPSRPTLASASRVSKHCECLYFSIFYYFMTPSMMKRKKHAREYAFGWRRRRRRQKSLKITRKQFFALLGVCLARDTFGLLFRPRKSIIPVDRMRRALGVKTRINVLKFSVLPRRARVRAQNKNDEIKVKSLPCLGEESRLVGRRRGEEDEEQAKHTTNRTARKHKNRGECRSPHEWNRKIVILEMSRISVPCSLS